MLGKISETVNLVFRYPGEETIRDSLANTEAASGYERDQRHDGAA